jgi:hypothetical protein
MNVTGAGLAALGGAPSFFESARVAQAQAAQNATVSDPRDPDLVVVNAKLYTMDARTPRAEAFAVKGDRFIAVGSTADVRNRPARTRLCSTLKA